MTEPMRILMISEHASPLATLGGVDAGGQNIYVAHVARCLARLGHQVDVLTRRDHPNAPTTVDMAPGVRVIHIEAGPRTFVPKEELLAHMNEFARGALRLLRNSRPYDLAHAHFFMSGQVAQHLLRSLGLPFVITFHALGLVRLRHQPKADAFPPERLGIELELVRDAACVIAECPQDAHDLEDLYAADPARMAMIPCGVDQLEFGPANRAQERASLGLRDDEFIILQLGRLVPRKGIDNVIRSLAHLPAHVPARLLVVGGETETPDEARTPEIGRLRGIAADCGVADRVDFIGHRKRAELRRFYAAADVFATTPWYEPFGITPLEAMACGTPVVGSAVGGIKFSVVDGVTGFLVPPRDPVALADRLAELHANPGLARAMGRAGMARTRGLFTWDHVAGALAEVYADVVATRTEPAALPGIDAWQQPPRSAVVRALHSP